MSTERMISRRALIKNGLASIPALVIGFHLPADHFLSAVETESPKTSNAVFSPNAWIRIDARGTVTLIVEPAEIGQGVRTSMPMLLAEELDADWTRIHIQQAETKPAVYKSLGTGGSGSVRTNWMPLRQAGAAARAMLVQAAAGTWKVDPSSCHTENGTVIHGSTKRHLAYGELVETASKLPVPVAEKVPLKDPKDFRFLGKPVPRLDTPSKVDGKAIFGMDVKVPGMLYAVIARCPTFGGKVAKYDDTETKKIPGVRAVFPIDPTPSPSNTAGGIAVVADTTWIAIKGRSALKVEWDHGDHVHESSDSLRRRMRDLAAKPPAHLARNDGDAEKSIAGAAQRIDAVYELPFQPHATMEPMNCTALVREDQVELWAPTQSPDWIQGVVAGMAKLKPEAIIVHETLSGGGFGRRYQTDYAVEAFQVAKGVGKPVKVVWTREDDMQHDFYRQASYHQINAGLDDSGSPVGWSHHILSTSIREYYEAAARKDPARAAAQELEAAVNVPYSIPNFRVGYSPVESGVPRAWWRSVACSFNTFVVESFVDELAAAAHQDPFSYRLKLLEEGRRLPNPRNKEDVLNVDRLRGVLNLAARESGWGHPLPKNRGRGIAALYSFGTYVCHVAEVEVKADGRVRVHRVVTAVDCGSTVNPNTIRAQMESAVIYGLTAALTGEISIKNGAVENSNFHNYPVLRIDEAPRHEVHIIPSREAPGGMGEPGVPPIAPAVTNAIFAATGKRLRRLILRPDDLKSS
jgi:isoquinoline 1-oxidoreductase beta subunit